MKTRSFAVLLIAASASTAAAQAVPFNFLDASYTAQIVSNSFNGDSYLGIAFANGKVYRSGFNRTAIQILDPSTLFNYHGDHLYTPTTVRVGVPTAGGIAFGTDGYLYGQSSSGLRRYNLTDGSSMVLPGSAHGTFGIKQTTLGEIAYNADDGLVHLYNLTTNTDRAVYASGTFNDDLAVGPNNIFIAALGNCTIRILDNTGTFIRSVNSPGGHCADGAAYGRGSIFANNTDATITRYDFPNGYTGAFTETLIASGKATYGDFAAAGPDGAFYLTRDSQIYSDGYAEAGRSLIRLELVGGGGFEINPSPVPEPGTVTLLATGLAGLFGAVRRRRRR